MDFYHESHQERLRQEFKNHQEAKASKIWLLIDQQQDTEFQDTVITSNADGEDVHATNDVGGFFRNIHHVIRRWRIQILVGRT